MRALSTLILFISGITLKAQIFYPGLQSGMYTNSIFNSRHLYDSTAQKKWFISHYVGLTAGFSFFNGGNAAYTSVPLSIQLNRRFNNNLYAFAGVAVAPTYINFNRTFANTNINKTNNSGNFFNKDNFNTYSSASLGLMYINDAKTFSISGSISVQKTDYPAYYYTPVNTTRPVNNAPVYR